MAGWIQRLFATGKCQSCEAMREQLLMMTRLLESKDAQIAMVLTKHYDRPVVQQTKVPDDKPVNLDHLMDVTIMDDEQFLAEMEKQPS